MEQLLRDIETYAAAMGRQPQRVLRDAIDASWGTWSRWKDGKASPTVKTVDRLRQWMRENPPSTHMGVMSAVRNTRAQEKMHGKTMKNAGRQLGQGGEQ